MIHKHAPVGKTDVHEEQLQCNTCFAAEAWCAAIKGKMPKRVFAANRGARAWRRDKVSGRTFDGAFVSCNAHVAGLVLVDESICGGNWKSTAANDKALVRRAVAAAAL